MNELEVAIFAGLLAFSINIIFCPIIIPVLSKIKFGQNIRTDGPQRHLKKSGTPTMGGIIILISFLICSSFFLKQNAEAKLLVFITLAFGIVGFLDDYIKIAKKRSLGLRFKEKIILQLLISIIFLYFIYKSDKEYSKIFIPFMEGKTLDVSSIFFLFYVFVIIGTVNSVNLTDGLDGLASGITILVSTFFIFISWVMHSDVLPITGISVGSLLGFLLFNTYPAKIFMGDTGSLALGGFIAGVSIILKMPLFLAIVGIIYVIESLSVILQVSYYKITKSKRIFKMAPIHHHYELKGLPETKIVTIFYIVTSIFCLIGFLATKNIFNV